MSETTASNSSSAAPACSSTKPKPCCVCQPEKSRRDECMLFSKAEDPATSPECKPLIDQYRACMKGFGFDV